MADIRPQLAMLLGKETKDIANIRKTSEMPPRVSVINVTMAITEKSRNQAERPSQVKLFDPFGHAHPEI